MNRRPYKLPERLVCDPKEAEVISYDLILKYIRLHESTLARYEYLENLYKGFHDVFNLPEKEDWKPDNRLAVNFPRYITDTFQGFGYGIPIKKSHYDDAINEAISEFDRNNDMDDHDAELIKYMCIYGHCFEYFYQDEETKTKVVALTPRGMFTVYDDTEKRRALFSVRYGVKSDGVTFYGEVLTKGYTINFNDKVLSEPVLNPYGKINCVEYILNEERMGIYEGVAGMTEVYNKSIGEKANDVDSFAEAYLAIIGSEIDEDGVRKIRDNRLINLYGTDNAKDILIQFMQKPTADGTQENLLDRLENLIYQMSMVANISDETFGNASGTALAYKLQSMTNLAVSVDRKLIKSMRKRYKLFCRLSTNVPDMDAWKDIEFKTTRNIPKNTLEEAQTAQTLEGIVSKETQLKTLSIVDNVKDEIEKMEEEEAARNEAAISMIYKVPEVVTDGEEDTEI